MVQRIRFYYINRGCREIVLNEYPDFTPSEGLQKNPQRRREFESPKQYQPSADDGTFSDWPPVSPLHIPRRGFA